MDVLMNKFHFILIRKFFFCDKSVTIDSDVVKMGFSLLLYSKPISSITLNRVIIENIISIINKFRKIFDK